MDKDVGQLNNAETNEKKTSILRITKLKVLEKLNKTSPGTMIISALNPLCNNISLRPERSRYTAKNEDIDLVWQILGIFSIKND